MARGLISQPSAAEIAHYGGRGLGGAPLGREVLDLFDTSKGTFTRGSVGYYFDGSQMQVAAANVRRIEAAGLLFEGSRTNYARNSAPPAVTAYWVGNSATFTPNVGPQFIAGVPSAQADFTATAAARVTSVFTVAPNDSSIIAVSCWVYSSGAGLARLTIQDKAGAISYSSDVVLVAGWQQLRTTFNVGVGAALPRVGVANGTDGAARTVYVAALNAEYSASGSTRWTSSFIDVPIATQVTRASDVLFYGSVEYPSSFLTRGFSFTVAPDFSSADFTATVSNECRFFGFNATTNNKIALVISSGTARIQAMSSGVSRVLTSTITFSRGQPVTVTAEPDAGRVTVEGATSGDGLYVGSAYTLPAGQLNVGNTHLTGTTASVFGHFDQYVYGLA